MWDIQPKMSLMQVTKDTHGASLERKPFISQRHRGGGPLPTPPSLRRGCRWGPGRPHPPNGGQRWPRPPRSPPTSRLQPASQPAAAPERADVETLWAACWGYARALPPPYFPRQWTSALSLARNAPPQRPDAPSGTPSPSRRPRAAAPPPAGWAPPPPPGRPGRLRPRSGPTRPRQRQAPPRRAWPHARTTSQPLALCFQTPARPPRPELQPPGCPSASRPSEHARAS